MELTKLIDGVNKGTFTATLFTQKNCKWCEKMKGSIVALNIPASEVLADADIVSKFELTVTPTLLITSKSELKRISGFKSPEDLKESIRKLH